MDNSERAGDHSVGEIEELVRQVEALPDPNARAIAVKLVSAVMEFHASAVARMLEIVSQSANGEAAVQSMVQNETVASLLVLHGLHPDDVETRVRRAVDSLQQFFETRDASISLAGIHDGWVTLRFKSKGGASGAAAKQIIEDALYQAAPEITALTIAGLNEWPEAGFVPLSALMGAAAR
jgi:uncharacterized alpha-E superfamily protein